MKQSLIDSCLNNGSPRNSLIPHVGCRLRTETLSHVNVPGRELVTLVNKGQDVRVPWRRRLQPKRFELSKKSCFMLRKKGL